MSKFVSVDKLLYFKQKLESLFTLKTNAIQTAIDNEVLARQIADNALDDELTDIRVGYDGTTYDSAGTAVRTQVSELKSDLSNKITKFYASNQGETHIADSDNGKIQDMMIYGKSSQNGTPTPDNPIEIQSVVNPKLTVCGKNLLSLTLQTQTFNGVTFTINDGTITMNGTATGTSYITISNNKIKKGNYRLVGCDKNGSGNKYYIYISKSLSDSNLGLAESAYDFGNGANFTTLNDGMVITILCIVSGFTYDNVVLKPMITADLTATYDDFEPYKEQTATLPYTLNAIPVTSGGNVTIDGQQYIADYVDIENKKLVKNVGFFDLGTFKPEFIESFGNAFRYFSLAKNLPTDYSSESIVISESYKLVGNIGKWSSISVKEDNTIGTVSAGKEYGFIIKNPSFTDAISFKQAMDGSLIYYKLATPTIINLTDEEVQAFKSLTTYYPTTNISVNSEQLDGYAIFNYPISMQNGWNYVKQQLNDNRDYIDDMDLQSAEAYVNSEYAVALTELEV